MDDKPLFENLDEYERTYAPQQLSPDDPDHTRVELEGDVDDTGGYKLVEPPQPAPVASPGSSPSSVAAPPNIGPNDGVGAPGDPDTQAEYPLDSDDSQDRLR